MTWVCTTWVCAQNSRNLGACTKLMKLLQIQQVGFRVEAWSTALPISHSAINFVADSVRLVMELSMGGKYNQSQIYRVFFFLSEAQQQIQPDKLLASPKSTSLADSPIQVGFTWRKKLNLSQDKIPYKARQNQGVSGRNVMNHW